MRIIVGISGASGIRLSKKLIEELNTKNIKTYTVITYGALKVLENEEEKNTLKKIEKNSTKLFREDELDAPIASSSHPTDGMVIIPCSMNTVAKIAHGIADNLLLRAADIQIKMKNNLVIVPRETPLSQIHLKNLFTLSKIHSIYVLFPVLTYYHNPKTVEDMENFIIGKILDIFSIKHNLYKRWKIDEK